MILRSHLFAIICSRELSKTVALGSAAHPEPVGEWSENQATTSSKRIQMLNISVRLRQYTRWSSNIQRMEVQRASLLWYCQMAIKGNFWRGDSGSCRRAIVFTHCWCPCPVNGKVWTFSSRVFVKSFWILFGMIQEPDGHNKSKIQGRRKSQPTAIVSLSVHCCNSRYVKKLGLVSLNFHPLRQRRLVCSQISKLQKQPDHTTKDSLQSEVWV